MNDNRQHTKILRRVAVVTFVANVLLFILKMVVGLVFDNLAVKADAWHSAADVVMPLTIIIVSFFISDQPDKKHNYGRERVETIFTLILAVVIAGIGVMLGVEGIHGLLEPVASSQDWVLIAVTIASLVIKEATFVYGIIYAKKIHSETLRINAWHNCSDGLSSIAVLIGLLCSKFMGNNIFESIAVIVVALLIIKVAIESMFSASSQLVDHAVDEKACSIIQSTAQSIEGVKAVNDLRTRMFGNRTCVDLIIVVEKDLTVAAGDKIAETVRQALLKQSEIDIKDCIVRVKPNWQFTHITLYYL